jgi:site-specific recombinase XerD
VTQRKAEDEEASGRRTKRRRAEAGGRGRRRPTATGREAGGPATDVWEGIPEPAFGGTRADPTLGSASLTIWRLQIMAVEAITRALTREDGSSIPNTVDLAVAAFLARYGGRTFEAYRHDLRTYFRWAADAGLDVFSATRGHIELYRATLEERGLAPTTIDRRLSTVCGFYRFAHIDGRIVSNPAQYVRRPRIFAGEVRGMDRGELGAFLFTAERFDRAHSALAVLLGLNGLRVSEACTTNIEDLGMERGHRTLRIVGKGNKLAIIPLVPRTARTIDLAVGERSEGPILRRMDGNRLDRRTAHRWVRSIGRRAGLGVVHPHMLRSAFIMAALDAGVPLRDVQVAARHQDPRTTTIYDRRRANFDRHAAYVVVAFVAGG